MGEGKKGRREGCRERRREGRGREGREEACMEKGKRTDLPNHKVLSLVS